MQIIDDVRKLIGLNWDWQNEASLRVNLNQIGFRLLQSQAEQEDQIEIWQNQKGHNAQLILQDASRPRQIALILQSEEIDGCDENEFSQLQEQMEADFEQAVSDLSQLLGQPDEVGTVSGSEHMSEQFADLGACWLRENHQLMLLYGQQDTELPLQMQWVVSAKSLP